MTTSITLTRSAGAAAIALALFATPVSAAVEDDAAEEVEAVEDAAVEDDAAEEEDEGGRRPMAETPRDRVGLFMLAALGLMGLAGGVTATRQLSGKRPQTDGEFRWR